jgi:glycosyltransferase involved in cell wall biosynthesis
MTIVHMGPSNLPILFPLGGATERRMRELAVRQAAAGSRVIVYSAGDRWGSQMHHGVDVRTVRCHGRGVLRSFEFMVKAVGNAKGVKPDVIHFHSLAEGAEVAGRVAARKVLSYDFFEFRRGKRNLLHPLYRRALEKFTCLMPVSDYCRRESAAYWSLPANRMQVVYNGVNLQQFRPDPAAGMEQRLAAGLKGDFTMLFVGRVCLQKGTDLLIEACRLLRAEGRTVRVVVAGPVGQFGTAGSNGLTERLQQIGGVYLGAVDESQLPAVYNMCDVFVMPTRAYEMFGMAAIEAQACGKPVVCSNQGGLPEVIGPESGLLFDAGDVQSLVQRVRDLMDTPNLCEQLSEAGVRNARRFAWENIVAQLDGLYRKVDHAA